MSAQHTPIPTLAHGIKQSEWNAHIALIERAVETFKDWPTETAKNNVALEMERCLAAITIAKATGSQP